MVATTALAAAITDASSSIGGEGKFRGGETLPPPPPPPPLPHSRFFQHCASFATAFAAAAGASAPPEEPFRAGGSTRSRSVGVVGVVGADDGNSVSEDTRSRCSFIAASERARAYTCAQCCSRSR